MTREQDPFWNVSFETKCQGMDLSIPDQHRAISFPIYQTATFSHRSLEDQTEFAYTRQSNPTRRQLERIMAHLENGLSALAFSSGMAAVSAMMELFSPGDHILVDADLYGGSIRLFDTISRKNGISVTTADLSSGPVEPLIRDNTKCIYLETPTNPMMHVTDIRALAECAHAHGALVAVDNTFLSPFFQNPLDLGADIVIHSGTKYICGHHDTIGGFLVVNSGDLDQKLRAISNTVGCAMAPFDSWLMLRGIRTLAVRMERAEQNAIGIARYLKAHPAVRRVIYPGLPDHPGYELMKKQARGFGSMISFEVPSREFAASVLKNVELFYFAESLGGTETLITYPVTQTHAEVPAELREKNGITDCLLRLSVGIEGVRDLISELDRVLELAGKSC